MAQTFQQEYMQMPPMTRTYSTACVLTTLAVVRVVYTERRDLFGYDINSELSICFLPLPLQHLYLGIPGYAFDCQICLPVGSPDGSVRASG